jgi:hypothetical protein
MYITGIIPPNRFFIIGAVLWILGSAGIAAELWFNVHGAGVAGAAFTILFIALLIHEGLRRVQEKTLEPPGIFPWFRHRGFIPVLAMIAGAIALIFLLGYVTDPRFNLILALDGAGALVLLKLFRKIRIPHILLGISVAAFGLVLEGLVLSLNPNMVFYLISTGFLALCGSLLLEEVHLSKISVMTGNFRFGARSLCVGALLALPAALLNAMGGAGTGDVWVQDWFDPIVALVPGITEEVWARLFLTTLLFVLLAAASPDRPKRAAISAVILAALAHSLAHYPAAMIFSPTGFIMGTLLAVFYGIPMGLLFVAEDLEHAIGYHACVDFLRFVVAYLHH